jgi:hypothetical protein
MVSHRRRPGDGAVSGGETPLEVNYRLDPDGRIRSMVFDRWGDPDSSGSFAWYPFGGEITGYRTFEGVTIPSGGRLGWFFGTDRWPAGDPMAVAAGLRRYLERYPKAAKPLGGPPGRQWHSPRHPHSRPPAGPGSRAS